MPEIANHKNTVNMGTGLYSYCARVLEDILREIGTRSLPRLSPHSAITIRRSTRHPRDQTNGINAAELE